MANRAHAPIWLAATTLLIAATFVRAQQSPSGSAAPASTAAPIPLSGRIQGGVTAQQSVQPAGSNVNVITPSIQIQGSYSGSTMDHGAADPVVLSLSEAVRRGLRFNLGQVSASTAVRQAQAQRVAALSALLPQVSASASETASKLNLQAEGLSSNTLGSFASLGVAFPSTVGPFHYYSLQGNLSASVLNLTNLYNYRSAQASADAASLNAKDARELVVLAVSGSYMQALGTEAEVQAQTDQVRYSQAVYDQARSQSDIGVKAEIDTTRSLVQLQTEQQRLRSEQNELKKQFFGLARMLGLPVNARITLTSALNDDPSIGIGEEQAVQQAFAQREDLKALDAQVRVGEATDKAAHAEHLPTASIQGDYGVQGVNPDKGSGVFSATASLTVPIFEGGRIRADVEQAKAALDQRRAELEDQRGVVELQVRTAYADLDVAATQVQVAKNNRELALKTLQQSRDRFAAGATDSVEVVQSEQTLGSAAQDSVTALYALNLARIDLARAMGVAERQIPTLLKDK